MKTLLEWKKVKGEYSQIPSVEEEKVEDKKVREKLDLDGSQLLKDLNPLQEALLIAKKLENVVYQDQNVAKEAY